jgi:hypothetical protein
LKEEEKKEGDGKDEIVEMSFLESTDDLKNYNDIEKQGQKAFNDHANVQTILG